MRALKAICVNVGAARSNETFIFGFSPFSSKVHTPFGPRKSGMPAAVEIPAPTLGSSRNIRNLDAHDNNND